MNAQALNNSEQLIVRLFLSSFFWSEYDKRKMVASLFSAAARLNIFEWFSIFIFKFFKQKN